VYIVIDIDLGCGAAHPSGVYSDCILHWGIGYEQKSGVAVARWPNGSCLSILSTTRLGGSNPPSRFKFIVGYVCVMWVLCFCAMDRTLAAMLVLGLGCMPVGYGILSVSVSVAWRVEKFSLLWVIAV